MGVTLGFYSLFFLVFIFVHKYNFFILFPFSSLMFLLGGRGILIADLNGGVIQKIWNALNLVFILVKVLFCYICALFTIGFILISFFYQDFNEVYH